MVWCSINSHLKFEQRFNKHSATIKKIEKKSFEEENKLNELQTKKKNSKLTLFKPMLRSVLVQHEEI